MLSSLMNVVWQDPLFKYQYVAKDTVVAVGGHGLVWSVRDAIDKETKMEVSVFSTPLKDIESRCTREDAEHVVSALKHGVQLLTRIRHPSLLKVVHALVEDRGKMSFVTERVVACLGNMLGTRRSSALSNPSAAEELLASTTHFECLIGMARVAEGIAFVQTSGEHVLLNLTPASIFVCKDGGWKIGDLTFACARSELERMQSSGAKNFQKFPVVARGNSYRLNPLCYPDLDCSAPEYVEQNAPELNSVSFSYGCILFEVCQTPTPDHHHGAPAPRKRLVNAACDMGLVDKVPLSRLQDNIVLNDNGATIRTIMALVCEGASKRPHFDVLASLPIYEPLEVRCMISLDTLPSMNPATKFSFFRDFYSSIGRIPCSLLVRDVFPQLQLELRDPQMDRFVLPLILQIVQAASSNSTNDKKRSAEYLKRMRPTVLNFLVTKHESADGKHVQPNAIVLEILSEQTVTLLCWASWDLELRSALLKYIDFSLRVHAKAPQVLITNLTELIRYEEEHCRGGCGGTVAAGAAGPRSADDCKLPSAFWMEVIKTIEPAFGQLPTTLKLKFYEFCYHVFGQIEQRVGEKLCCKVVLRVCHDEDEQVQRAGFHGARILVRNMSKELVACSLVPAMCPLMVQGREAIKLATAKFISEIVQEHFVEAPLRLEEERRSHPKVEESWEKHPQRAVVVPSDHNDPSSSSSYAPQHNPHTELNFFGGASNTNTASSGNTTPYHSNVNEAAPKTNSQQKTKDVYDAFGF